MLNYDQNDSYLAKENMCNKRARDDESQLNPGLLTLMVQLQSVVGTCACKGDLHATFGHFRSTLLVIENECNT